LQEKFYPKLYTFLPGVHLTRKIDKLGMRCSDTGEIFFEDVRVPASNVIGEEGQGFIYQMLQFQEERLFGAASGYYLPEYSA
jgi:citronellyl-CoA dehydrogenase